MVGPLAARFRDVFPSSLGIIPGPELHLHAMAALARDGFLVRPPLWVGSLLALVAALAAAFVVITVRRGGWLLPVLGVIFAAYLVAAWLLFDYAAILPPITYPLAAFLFTGLSCFGYDFATQRRETRRVRRTLERYVSRDVVREILDHKEGFLAELGGKRKEVVVLFSDIRGFTALAEKTPASELVPQLNEYLAAMVRAVFKHRGTLDKFVGDAVMATWGTVVTAGHGDDCLQAVRAACNMLDALDDLNRRWRERGVPTFRIGIGIHGGEAVFGNIGSEEKMEPTIIGDAVNLASRIESLTKRYDQPLLVSDAVARLVRLRVPLRTVDTVRVAGREQPVTLYAPVRNETGAFFRPKWLEDYEQGLAHFRGRKFLEAAECLERTLESNAGERLTIYWLERCRLHLANPPAAEWDPVTRLEEK